tara:strand:+ start:2132 stop:2434 length:303 start_codon:yes stop_codon:yes gene_type:complete
MDLTAKNLIEDINKYKELVENLTKEKNDIEEKFYGYKNVQTYRLCVILDNKSNFDNPLTEFMSLVDSEQFEYEDIKCIDWNEIFKRYSDQIENSFNELPF